MRILFVASTYNSMTQRAWIELDQRDHQVRVHLMRSGRPLTDTLATWEPELVVAPYLTERIPDEVWQRYTCLVVHPGPPGDRGASSLDHALLEGRRRWGVTIVQATARMDAGPVWAWAPCQLPTGRSKAAIYRREVTDAAMQALVEAVSRFEQGLGPLDPQPEPWPDTGWRPRLQAEAFALDWQASADELAARVRAADSAPGAPVVLGGRRWLAFGATEEDHLRGPDGSVLAHRHGAICVGCGEGALWLSHLRAPGPDGIKLPAALALHRAGMAAAEPVGGTIDILGEAVPDLPEDPFAEEAGRRFREIRYEEEEGVGYLHFDFYNGAMNTDQCRRLLAAFERARRRPVRVIVLMGGADLWSNGIHLNCIEAAPHPAEEAWQNILAMDDLVEALIRDTDHYLVSVLQGNAGAGGVALALAADKILAREGIVLNPHTRNMGLYGSEFWTYLLPRRIGTEKARLFTEACLPWGTTIGRQTGLIDEVLPAEGLEAAVRAHARAIARLDWFDKLLMGKRFQRRKDEAFRPLERYREEELARMHRNFFEDDMGFAEKRRNFVFKRTDPHLACQLMERDWYSARRTIYRYRRYESVTYTGKRAGG